MRRIALDRASRLQVVPLLIGRHKFRVRGFVCVLTEVGVAGLHHVYLYKQVPCPNAGECADHGPAYT